MIEPVTIGRGVTGLGAGKSDDWHTPPNVFEALGCCFDLDVAAPKDGPLHVPCRDWIWRGSLDARWRGFVWMNPPFGGRNGLAPWMRKFFQHGNGIALTPDRTSSPWFHESWQEADAVLFSRKTPFLLPNGKLAGSPAFGTALWAIGRDGVDGLMRAHNRGFGLLCYPVKAAKSEGDLFLEGAA